MIQNEDDQLVELVALDEDNDSDAATADDDDPNDNVDGKHNADPSGHHRNPTTLGPLAAELREKLAPVFGKIGLGDARKPELSRRCMVLRSLVGQFIKAGEETLILSSRLYDLDYIELAGIDPRAKIYHIDGKVRVQDRTSLADKFNNEETPNVILLSMTAGGVGINL
ncbi:hypothetical protein PV05_00781 [Exophiala xenobiotica]|uniref:Helicase C-terminal domain-containing protein n=1 Tax=Exophiala xenobiotica TaxID=348802 RepID=A0A0D2FKB4_9EURO|nr:uncharacterized protein PV05_00781 [Exophiala xenobiotica]KIW60574.1 hypothetical protein PV05_00781 [Exophiala xenobiotica]